MSRELRQQRGEIVAKMQALTDLADSEKRNLDPTENANWNEMFAKQESLAKEIREYDDRVVKQAQLKEEMRSNTREAQRGSAGGGKEEKRTELSEDLPDEIRESAAATEEYRDAFNKYFKTLDRGELRSFMVGSGAQAGYVVAPVQMVEQWLIAKEKKVFIRAQATKWPLPSAMKMAIPELTSDPDEPTTVNERTTGSEDTSMAVGQRYLEPHPKGEKFKMSADFLRLAPQRVQRMVFEQFAKVYAYNEEKKFLLGTGYQEALGVFVAHNGGIPSTRDVSSGNLATSPTFDGLIACKYSLREEYRMNAAWMFHRNVIEVIAKLKDGDGNYMWRESVRQGEPDTLLGLPLRSSEFCPNTLTANQYAGILGDFSEYWIADAYDLQVQALYEVGAEDNEVIFLFRSSYDGRPVRAEAFSRVKLGA